MYTFVKNCYNQHVLIICLLWLGLSFQAYANVSQSALVIGNSQHEVGELNHSVQNAKCVAKALQEKGFDVTLLYNQNLRQMDNAILEFRKRALAKKGVGLFYFSGYATQIGGKNYLLPIDNGRIKDEIDIKHKAISLDIILEKMRDSTSELNVIILDTTLDVPYLDSYYRSKTDGLADVVDIPLGTFIEYATAPGETTLFHPKIYTKHLIEGIQAGGRIDDVLVQVSNAVAEKSNNKQIPRHQNQLKKVFCFGSCKKSSELPPNNLACMDDTIYGEYSENSGNVCKSLIFDESYLDSENSGNVCKSLIFDESYFCKSLKLLDTKKFSGVFSEDWLLRQNPNAYTLQIFSVRVDKAKIKEFTAKYPQINMAMFKAYEPEHHRYMFKFVTGIYANRKKALNARKSLPKTLEKAWPLTLADVQKQIRYNPLKINNLTGLKKEALTFAFQLYTKKIPYKYGGKTEKNGFDTSGFVAYVLHKVGLLGKNYFNYWSGKLRTKYKTSSLSPEIGDLVFYKGGYVFFYLGNNLIIGMTGSRGIIICEMIKSDALLGYGHVRYYRRSKK
jgi:hypothetical protein